MGRDTNIANDLRAAGLRVVECSGWQTRGSTDFNPQGSVNHHTAGSSSGSTPSLNGVIHGHAGSAPGPLANALQSREPDGNDIFYVVAAGRANHAGEGGWKGLSGNSTVYGLEIEHTGVDPLPQGRQKLAARFHAALARGRYSEGMVCQHREWAPNRKIDAAEQVDPNQFRAWVKEYISGTPAPPKPVEEVEMWTLNEIVEPGENRDNPTYCVIPLPDGRKAGTTKYQLFVDTDPKHGASIYGSYQLNGTNFGQWDKGNDWELWVPGRKALIYTVRDDAFAMSFKHFGNTPDPKNKAKLLISVWGQ